ncbi:MAG: glycosyltransferase [Planctomycetota bacterium]|jgi:dolichol-phosphate mannosyltransferase
MDESAVGNGKRPLREINLGIVCPMANEKETAADLVHSILEHCKGFKSVKLFTIFDSSCKDGTYDLLKQHESDISELEVVWAPENSCVVDAYIRGYREALKANCDWILEIDGGFSHQPSEIPQFFDKMSKGYDCVFGSRFCNGGQFTDAPVRRYIISRWGSVMVNILLGTRLKDMTSGFEMFTRQSLESVLEKGIKSRGHFFQTEIKVFCQKFRITEVPIHYRQPSLNVNTSVLLDAFSNLIRLFFMRLSGRL